MSSGEEIIIDDNANSVLYSPPNVWEASTGLHRHGDSYHGTHEPGAYVTLSFNGSYIAYYSDKNADHGDFSVQIDVKLFTGFSSYAPDWVSPSMLLFGADLSPGTHTLTLTNSMNRTWIGVDYFLYHPSGGVAEDHDSIARTATPPACPQVEDAVTAEHSRGVSMAKFNKIIGLLVGIVLPICSAIPSIFLLRARRQVRLLKQQLGSQSPTIPDVSPQPPPYADSASVTITGSTSTDPPGKVGRTALLTQLFGRK